MAIRRMDGRIPLGVRIVQTQAKKAANQPYCSNCGYVLAGLTESSKCPECGKPIVEVLTRPSEMPNFGKRYRSKATLFGLPVVDIATGPKNGEMRGKAKGIIAIGDIATGGIAIGGLSIGVVALGGMAIGLCSMGGGAIGLLSAGGGMAVGGLATGGFGAGGLATGGMAVGAVAQGGAAFGAVTRDHRGVLPPSDGPAAFERASWFFGSWPPGAGGTWQSVAAITFVSFAVALVIVIAACIKAATTEDGLTNVA
jgi:ribosomal protein L34E